MRGELTVSAVTTLAAAFVLLILGAPLWAGPPEGHELLYSDDFERIATCPGPCASSKICDPETEPCGDDLDPSLWQAVGLNDQWACIDSSGDKACVPSENGLVFQPLPPSPRGQWAEALWSFAASSGHPLCGAGSGSCYNVDVELRTVTRPNTVPPQLAFYGGKVRNEDGYRQIEIRKGGSVWRSCVVGDVECPVDELPDVDEQFWLRFEALDQGSAVEVAVTVAWGDCLAGKESFDTTTCTDWVVYSQVDNDPGERLSRPGTFTLSAHHAHYYLHQYNAGGLGTVRFGVTSTSRLDVGPDSSLDGQDDVTLCAWIRPDGATPPFTIATKEPRYRLGLGTGPPVDAYFVLVQASVGNVTLASDGPSIGDWQFVCLEYDDDPMAPSTDDNPPRFYVDGAAVSAQSNRPATEPLSNDDNTPLTIGGQFSPTLPAFKGCMAHAHFYSGSDLDIDAIYRSPGLSPVSGGSLLAYAPLLSDDPEQVECGSACALSATASDLVPCASEPPVDLEITASGKPDPATKGGQITYTVTITNHGEIEAKDVYAWEYRGLGLQTVSTTGCDQLDGEKCSFDSIPVGDSKVFTVVADVAAHALSPVKATWTVTCPTVDSDRANNETTVSTTVADP